MALSDEKREQVKALLANGLSKNDVAKKCKISWATVNSISKEDPDEIESFREQKRQEFVTRIWEDMDSALELGRQKIKLAKAATDTFQETVDKLVDALRDKDADPRDVMHLISELASVMNIPLSHISTYFGTLYDKQALMTGGKTADIGLTFEDQLRGLMQK